MKYIVGFTISVLFSCSNKSVDYKPVQIPCTLSRNLDTARLYIQGTWNWVEYKEPIRGQGLVYETPASEGYTLTIKLENDTIRFFRNNKPDSVYKYRVVTQGEITGTNYPDDLYPVLAIYGLVNGVRQWYVPLKICESWLLLQYQFVTSLGGEQLWKKQ